MNIWRCGEGEYQLSGLNYSFREGSTILRLIYKRRGFKIYFRLRRWGDGFPIIFKVIF